MIKYGKLLVLLVVIFVSLFLINATVMYSLFEINVLKAGSADRGNKIEPSVIDEFTADETAVGEITVDEFATDETTAGEITTDDITAGEFAAGTQERSREGSGFNFGGSGGSRSEGYYMTADEVEFLKRRLGLVDKISAMAIISSMEKDAIDEIYSLSLDGVTIDEFEEISQTMEGQLSASELDEIMTILNKSKLLFAESGR